MWTDVARKVHKESEKADGEVDGVLLGRGRESQADGYVVSGYGSEDDGVR